MRTYRQVFSIGEFRALFGGQVAIGAAMTIQALAVSVLIYRQTASPLLAAAAFLAGSLPQAIGAVALSGLADRLPARDVLVTTDLVRAAGFGLIAAGHLPVEAVLAVLMVSGVVLGALAGIRLVLMTRVLPGDAYVLGRSVLDTAGGGMQVAGYAIGGTLIALLGARRVMWFAFALAIIACLVDTRGLRRHRSSAGRRRADEPTWRTTRRLMSGPLTRRLLLGQWVPNGLIVGAEALFVPYAPHRAAVLLITAAAGLLTGTVLVGRWVPSRWQGRASVPLYLLLALPYLAFAAAPPLPVAVALVAVSSIGYAGTFGIQQRLVTAVEPDELGQALALSSAGMLTCQGVAAYLAGAIAQLTAPSVAMAVMGAGSLLATVALLVRPVTRVRSPVAVAALRSPDTTCPQPNGSPR
jgi:MFS family permease